MKTGLTSGEFTVIIPCLKLKIRVVLFFFFFNQKLMHLVTMAMLPPPRTGTLLANQLEPPHISHLMLSTYHLFIYDICLRLKIRCLFSGKNLCICREDYAMLPPPNTGRLLTNQLEPLPDCLFDGSLYATSPVRTPLSFHTLNYLFIYDICSVINI